MKITMRQLRRIIREVSYKDMGQLHKGDKVMVSEDGLFKFAQIASHSHREIENTLHSALKNQTVGRVLWPTPDRGYVMVNFDGHEFEIDEYVLEKV